MSVYEQLLEWQRIPHARREWKKYREELTDFVMANTSRDSVAAVLGAGHCDDLDLAKLAGHCGKLILVDSQVQPMQEACRSYGLDSDSGRIELQEHEFLGISQAGYEEYSDTLQEGIRLRGANTDIRELAELARRKLEELYVKAGERPLELVTGECEYLVVAGVHSQLNTMAPFIWNAYEQALRQRAPELYPYFAAQNDRVIRRFDEKALETAKCGIIYALETQRLGIPGSVQGAVQGLQNIRRFQSEGRLLLREQRKLLWNFDIAQGIAYEMAVIAAETGCEAKGRHD